MSIGTRDLDEVTGRMALESPDRIEFRDDRGRTIQSVGRALTIIEILADANEPLALNEIAALAQLNVSTCHHLVATLVGRGYVLHAGRNRGYMLSSRLNELVDMNSREIDLGEFVRPKLTALAEQLVESAQMAVLRGTNLVTQLRADYATNVREADEFKKMTALHATATGKAILAWLPETEMVRVISQNGLTAYTERTITSLSGLIEELRNVRRNGFSVDDQELEKGVVCCGSVVRDEKGAVIASISVTFAAEKNSDAYRSHVIKRVVQCGRSLSDQLKVSRA
ncbi:IclR family transcriptional regulator [Pararhizobium mangrovi]|uniref:IclR family transcriptional regulator n=1 Tax=Pararhizobium mangrovi TaxID=2590452 RepID=A0A506UI10_9HYPH|nr:IclR family transcriptional regulator [Pararhizobium mangrovi]TPW32933.1 IclR family transcriptional regulator [Pararhizobium mangrovi]